MDIASAHSYVPLFCECPFLHSKHLCILKIIENCPGLQATKVILDMNLWVIILHLGFKYSPKNFHHNIDFLIVFCEEAEGLKMYVSFSGSNFLKKDKML